MSAGHESWDTSLSRPLDPRSVAELEGQFPGDFRVDLSDGGFVMTPELLDAAVPVVRRLVVDFGPRRRQEDEAFGVPLLPACSLWIFKLKNLSWLVMRRYPFPTLPDQIADLGELRHLQMYGSALSKLPRTIGRLQNLEELDLYTSYGLHYLPIEVLACPRLKDSRFSTRVLLNNHKNRMGLPALPDRSCAAEQRVSPAMVLAVFEHHRRQGQRQQQQQQPGRSEGKEEPPSHPHPMATLPAAVARRVLSFLGRDSCSVCVRQYLHDSGCYVWSHCVVGTDRQALLAACCSHVCADTVPDQVRWRQGPGAHCNERLICGSWVFEGTSAWGYERAAEKLPVSPKERAAEKGYYRFYKDFRSAHLTPYTPAPAHRFPAYVHPALAAARKALEDSIEHRERYRVVDEGDVRSSPNSQAPPVRRLVKGEFLETSRRSPSVSTPEDSRVWVFFNQQRREGKAQAAAGGWTAMTKKSGELKLQRVAAA